MPIKLSAYRNAFSLHNANSFPHACIIFDDMKCYRKVAFSFIREGLDANQKCIMAVDFYHYDMIAEDFAKANLDIVHYLEKGKLKIIDVCKSYSGDQGFDPDRTVEIWQKETEKAISENFNALRVVGEATFSLGKPELAEKLIRYENIMNQVLFKKYPFVSLCVYDKKLYPPEIIKGAIKAHPIFFYNDELFAENIHYVPPEIHFQKDKSNEEIDKWLGNVRKNNENIKALRILNETLEQKIAARTRLAESRARQLQKLSVDLIEAEEKERQRISDLLHDDLQQLIASARMQVQLAFEKPNPGPTLKNVERLLGYCLEKSRRLSHELSPQVLHQFGLEAGLEWLVRHMYEQFGLKVQLTSKIGHHVGEAPLKIFFFRAVQELLFNSVKYSGVKNVTVYLYGTDSKITLVVSDQGRGFHPDLLDSFNRKAGIGLISLRERAAAIRGNLDIKSEPGKGSRFTLTVPIRLTLVGDPEKPARVEYKSFEMHEKQMTISDSQIIRVLFAVDHNVMRQGLIGIVADQPGIMIAGEAANGEGALELARQLRPDVILMDGSMPGMGGVEATRRIKAEVSEVKVIGLSMFEDDAIMQNMYQVGADGFISKTESASDLLKAIYGIAKTGRDLSESCAIEMN